MKFPAEERDRENFIREVLEQCLTSIPERRAKYAELRKWLLYGGTGSVTPRFNKIFPTVDQLTAFTFAAESVRFALELSEHEETDVTGDEPERADILSKAIRDTWHDGHGDRVFTEAVFWAYGYGNTIVKKIWLDGQMRYYLVEPGNFGVIREDCPFLDDQEAVAECYSIGKGQLRRMLLADGKRSGAVVDEFMSRVHVQSGTKTEPEEENFVGRLVISQSQPTMVGSVADLQNWSSGMVPQVREDLVEMHELRIWDDDLDDYRIITLAGSDTIVFDRPNESMFCKGDLCYTNVCPSPVYNYFWGKSEVEALIPLQTWREDRMRQIDGLWQRQLKPPVFMSGVMGLVDEKAAALFRPAGVVGDQNPTAKATQLTPSMPPDMFAEIREIDQMFEYTVGLPPVTQGRGEPGVRAGDQASEMARMPAARMRKRALQVESALERIGEMTFKMLQRESRKVYRTQDGEKFVAGQFPDDYCVSVAAHTSSPLFAADLKQDAQGLFKDGVIDGETLLEMMDPPQVQVLMARYRKRQRAQEQAQGEEKALMEDALKHLAPPEKANILERLMTAVKGQKKG